jgi:D-alanyl-D-alanine dipeptidase
MQAYKFFISLLLILDIYYCAAQKLHVNEYGLTVLLDKHEFLETTRKDSSKQMVELKKLIPNIHYELRYAGTNNFMKRKMYPGHTTHTFLRLPAARSLKAVQDELNAKGLGLKVWDAYRPYSVTEQFWQLVKDERYVADPRKGSGHNRGIAIDLTILNLQTGKELDMGTGFDNFSDTAHHNFKQLPNEVLRNRDLLKSVMEKNGFLPFDTEWWHYSLPNPSVYEIMDIPFKEMNKVAAKHG